MLKEIKKIASGTCCLQGHCCYAEAIVISRKCLCVDENGHCHNTNPSDEDIKNAVENISKNIYKCFCPDQNKCISAKYTKILLDNVKSKGDNKTNHLMKFYIEYTVEENGKIISRNSKTFDNFDDAIKCFKDSSLNGHVALFNM